MNVLTTQNCQQNGKYEGTDITTGVRSTLLLIGTLTKTHALCVLPDVSVILVSALTRYSSTSIISGGGGGGVLKRKVVLKIVNPAGI